MKKAYNVYSILGKAVSKAAMLTSVFALCFLFSGEMLGQTPALGSKNSSSTGQNDFLDYQGVSVPYTAFTDNVERLDLNLIERENAVPIVENLLEQLSPSSVNSSDDASEEMENGIRVTFLETLHDKLVSDMKFDQAFKAGLESASIQYSSFNVSLYNGPTVNTIAEGYITNFF